MTSCIVIFDAALMKQAFTCTCTHLWLDDLEEDVPVGHVELGFGVREGVRLEVT